MINSKKRKKNILVKLAVILTCLMLIIDEATSNKKFKRNLKYFSKKTLYEVEKILDRIFDADVLKKNKDSASETLAILSEEILKTLDEIV